MKTVLAFGGVAALMLALFSANEVDARPQYQKAFLAKYKNVTVAAKKAKCNVCHR